MIILGTIQFHFNPIIMKALPLLSVALFLQGFMAAQTMTHQWSYSWGNTEPDPGPQIVVDPTGHIYATGYFTGTVDFDPGTGETFLSTGPFLREVYVSKFDPSGQFLWVIRLVSSALINVKDLAYDPAGYILLTGDYTGTVDFDPGAESHAISSNNFSADTYILKLTQDGDFTWVRSTQGTGQEYGNEVTVDADGHIYAAGIFTGQGEFDPGPGLEVFVPEGLIDGFISKYDGDGNYLWTKHHAGSFQLGIYGMETDQAGNLYVGGAFDDIRDFDPGPDSTVLTASGAWDAFFQKFDPDGNFLWVRTLSNGADNWVFDLKLDIEDQVLITGYYSGTLDFDQGTENHSFTADLNDVYVAKYSGQGDYIWASVFEGTSFDRANALFTSEDGRVYTTGFFGDQADFDPGPGTALLISTGQQDTDDAFLSILDSDGHFVFARNIGGKDNDAGSSLAVDNKSQIIIAGAFNQKAAFYPDLSAPDSLASHGSTDVFMARWSTCVESLATIDATSCEETYTSPSGNYQWTSAGTYKDTILNAFGCDSILTIHLTFTDINTNLIIIPEGILIAEEMEASYQWVDCENGFVPVAGATNIQFEPQDSGVYGVILSKGTCKDTSECILVNTTSIHDPLSNQKIELDPNPFSERLNVHFNELQDQVRIALRDVSGQLIWSDSYQGIYNASIQADLLPGLYLVEIQSFSGQSIFKVIKQ
jgi:hypothetical protein